MSEIAIYVEGGGDTVQQKADLRRGFDGLLHNVKSRAREKKLGWRVIPAGGRIQTYEAFLNALRMNPEIVNILLVDSETDIQLHNFDNDQDSKVRVAHLTQQGWDLSKAKAVAVHLMVQCMEAWIVSDADALEGFYGQKFVRNALPARTNLEQESKQDIFNKLEKATRNTQKGEYGKIKHASLLLQKIDRAKVEQRCPRFAIFSQWLRETVESIQ